MYEIKSTGEKFDNFTEAVMAAQAVNSEVIQAEGRCRGTVRWTPPPPVSEKKNRRYRERMAAYEASLKI